MMPAMTKITASSGLHLPAMHTLAATGPTTHNMNALNAPKKLIIAPNSGTRMETETDRNVNRMRSMAVPKDRSRLEFLSFWSVWLRVAGEEKADLDVGRSVAWTSPLERRAGAGG